MVNTNSNNAIKVAERSNHSLPIYMMNTLLILFHMPLTEHLLFNRTYFVNIIKMSDIAKLLFQD